VLERSLILTAGDITPGVQRLATWGSSAGLVTLYITALSPAGFAQVAWSIATFVSITLAILRIPDHASLVATVATATTATTGTTASGTTASGTATTGAAAAVGHTVGVAVSGGAGGGLEGSEYHSRRDSQHGRQDQRDRDRVHLLQRNPTHLDTSSQNLSSLHSLLPATLLAGSGAHRRVDFRLEDLLRYSCLWAGFNGRCDSRISGCGLRAFHNFRLSGITFLHGEWKLVAAAETLIPFLPTTLTLEKAGLQGVRTANSTKQLAPIGW
jgi:hypothetical protein